MNIGKERRTIIIEPIEAPNPAPDPQEPAPSPVPEPRPFEDPALVPDR